MKLIDARKRFGPLAVLGFTALLAAGCAARHTVVSSTGTTLGIEISQSPQTQMYQAKLGYNRAEIAVVPSNRSAEKEAGLDGDGNGVGHRGAQDTTDVFMEMRSAGWFSIGENSGLYQRLAVGSTAVRQPGAAFMFARGHGGEIESDAADAIRKSIASIPADPPEVRDFKYHVSLLYKHGTDDARERIDAALKAAGMESFDQFTDLDRPLTPVEMTRITEELRKKDIQLKENE